MTLPSLPTNISAGASAHVAHHNALHGAYNKRPTVSITEFGAVGDSTTDNSTAIQNAIDAVEAAEGGVVFVPAAQPGKHYLISTPLVINQNDIEMRGVGYRSTIRNNSGNVLNICTTRSLQRLQLRNLELWVNSGDSAALEIGHDTQPYAASGCIYEGVHFRAWGSTQGVGIKAVKKQVGYDNLWLNCRWAASGGNVNPVFWCAPVGGGAFNQNVIIGGRVTGSTNGAAPLFLFQSGNTANWLYNNAIIGTNFEIPTSGAVRLVSVTNFTLRDVGLYDLVGTSASLIQVDKLAGGFDSQWVNIDQVSRIGGTSSPHYEVQLRNCKSTFLKNVGASLSANGRLDLGDTTCTLINPQAATIVGASKTNLINAETGVISQWAP